MTAPPAPPEAFDNDSRGPTAPDPDILAKQTLASGSDAASSRASSEVSAASLEAVRSHVLRRVGLSRERDRSLVTVRHDGSAQPAQRRTLHERIGPARRGEPDRAELLALAAGSGLCWPPQAEAATLDGRVVEWLVLAGEVDIDGDRFGADDFLRHPLARAGHSVESSAEARVYVRVGAPVLASAQERVVARGADAVWDGDPAYLQRRVLWVDDAEAALLIRATAGVTIAPHRHRVNEECLVLRGEVFAGDVLIRGGDYQLAPAGCVHGNVTAETDVLVYLRGDTDYEYVTLPDVDPGVGDDRDAR